MRILLGWPVLTSASCNSGQQMRQHTGTTTRTEQHRSASTPPGPLPGAIGCSGPERNRTCFTRPVSACHCPQWSHPRVGSTDHVGFHVSGRVDRRHAAHPQQPASVVQHLHRVLQDQRAGSTTHDRVTGQRAVTAEAIRRRGTTARIVVTPSSALRRSPGGMPSSRNRLTNRRRRPRTPRCVVVILHNAAVAWGRAAAQGHRRSGPAPSCAHSRPGPMHRLTSVVWPAAGPAPRRRQHDACHRYSQRQRQSACPRGDRPPAVTLVALRNFGPFLTEHIIAPSSSPLNSRNSGSRTVRQGGSPSPGRRPSAARTCSRRTAR